jgi:protoporphyrinogen oxidase
MNLHASPVIIIGAGMAGLTCAHYLHEQGIPFLLLEKERSVGGRIRTDQVEGFLLDRGFQVFLTSYPEARRVLQYDQLELRDFQQGAMVWQNKKFSSFSNPLREPLALGKTLLAPVGSLSDKMRVARLVLDLWGKDNDALLHEHPMDTASYLRHYGWSSQMINSFFKPFFGGVFLERELQTASNFFRFIFKQFFLSDVCLPSQGIQAIPEQLARGLPVGSVRLDVAVQRVDEQGVTLEGGERLAASAVVVAADGTAASTLLPQTGPSPAFCTTTCVYFAAPVSPLSRPMLVINPKDEDLIHNLCVPTDIAPTYSSDGRALISVSTQGQHALSREELLTGILQELKEWFGDVVEEWQHLATYMLPQALPQYQANQTGLLPLQLSDRLYRCGDYTAYPSLNGAMQTGREVAEKLIAARK